MSAPAPPEPHTPGLLARLPRTPRKVVIVRANRIGDFLCATPAFRALRAALPNAEITLVGLPFVRDLVARSTAHIAYARGTPTVVVFGGTDPAQWGPPPGSPARILAHPVACRPCELPACPIGYPCLEGVTVADVVAAAEEIWGVRADMVGDAIGVAVAPNAC